MFSDENCSFARRGKEVIMGNLLFFIHVTASYLIPTLSLNRMLQRNRIIVKSMFLSHSSVLLNHGEELNLSEESGEVIMGLATSAANKLKFNFKCTNHIEVIPETADKLLMEQTVTKIRDATELTHCCSTWACTVPFISYSKKYEDPVRNTVSTCDLGEEEIKVSFESLAITGSFFHLVWFF